MTEVLEHWQEATHRARGRLAYCREALARFDAGEGDGLRSSRARLLADLQRAEDDVADVERALANADGALRFDN